MKQKGNRKSIQSSTLGAHVARDVTLVLEQVCAAFFLSLAFPAQLYAEDTLRFASLARRRRYLKNDSSYDLENWHGDTPLHYASTEPNPAKIVKAVWKLERFSAAPSQPRSLAAEEFIPPPSLAGRRRNLGNALRHNVAILRGGSHFYSLSNEPNPIKNVPAV